MSLREDMWKYEQIIDKYRQKVRNYMNDEKRFCSKCSWNDCDYGCTCPPNEEVYQCEMYMYYHLDEVNEFNKAMEEWARHDKAMEEWTRQKIESENNNG